MADVICVGGGVAGAVTAGILARHGRKVLVLERRCVPRDKACGEGILPHGVAILDELGVPLPQATLTRGIRFRVLEDGVRGGGGVDGMEPAGRENGRRSAGGISGGLRSEPGAATVPFPEGRGLAVRRRELDAALRAFAAASGAEIRETTVRRVEVPGPLDSSGPPARRKSGGALSAPVRVTTDSEVVEGSLLVGADGAHSLLHRSLNLQIRDPGTRIGFSTHFTGFAAEPDLVEVVCFRGGEVYIAPVGGGVTLIALLAERRLALRSSQVVSFLRSLFPVRMAGARLAGPVLGKAPLSFSVDRMAGERWALVGDAAGCVDPLTGEGMSLALVGGSMLAEALEAALALRDAAGVGAPGWVGPSAIPWSRHPLAAYERRARAYRGSIERLTSVLLFAARRPWLARRLLRWEAAMAPMMRVATGMEPFAWGRLARAVLGG